MIAINFLFSAKISEGGGVWIVDQISKVHLAFCYEEIVKIQPKNNTVDWPGIPGQVSWNF
jgi:hypothetical protein